ncbi:MAG: AAA family ATPase [Blastocatellia bacterium]
MRGKRSQTFARIARQWLGVVNAEIVRLTDEERATDRIPDPYTPLDPLKSGSEIFLGRANAYRFIEDRFLREGRNATIVLYGQRRIGKSSVLRNLEVRLTTNLIPVYVDMQRSAAVESTGGLLFNLADAISRALVQRGVRLKQPALNDYAAEPFIVFGKFLDEVEEAIHAPENRLILALDEFELIEDKLTTGKVSLDLMPFLRNMMQHRQGVSLIFAGTHTLDEMISDYWIPYFNTAVPLRVSYLDEGSARKLITQPIDDFPLKYEPEAVDLLIEQTRCHPCLIQLTCQALVDMKNEHRSRHATVEDVEQSLEKALDNDYALRSLWDWVPENERPLLAHVASAEPASIKQVARALSEAEAKARAMAEHLVKAEILMREGEEPVYRFQVPLFRRWVARHAALTGIELDQRQIAVK